jgi:hypothetical protein
VSWGSPGAPGPGRGPVGAPRARLEHHQVYAVGDADAALVRGSAVPGVDDDLELAGPVEETCGAGSQAEPRLSRVGEPVAVVVGVDVEVAGVLRGARVRGSDRSR